MGFGKSDPREFREMEIDMLARKEQAKNMAQNVQDHPYEESKTSKVVTIIVITLVIAFVVFFVFFA